MSYEVLETNLPLPLHKRGKVRDIYDLGDRLLIVSTDRISAFDVVLQNAIPSKGEALNRLSVFWFKKTEDIVPNHILDIVDPNTVLVRKAKPIKIEFVVRGYLYGSAWRSYREGKNICGIKLPSDLRKAERLPEPILTPTTKAEVGHDIEMTKTDVSEKIGKEAYKEIEEACLKLYERACSRAEKNGIIIADTKLEFGFCNGDLILIDELFTSDSSRFWPSDKYEVEKNQISFDKQGVRDYLESTGWNKQPPAPSLPEHIIIETSRKYIEAYERLTGRRF
ncbi:MAG: phosphoribosylaminoimidazolesuccinocarboxamide synthase [Candidatus Bathyarchaeia archaeon]